MGICPYATVQNNLARWFFFTTVLKAARKGSLLFQSVYFDYLWLILHVSWSGPQVWKVWCHLCLDFSLVCWLLGDMSGLPQKAPQFGFFGGQGVGGGILLLSVRLICCWLELSHAACLHWRSCLEAVKSSSSVLF